MKKTAYTKNFETHLRRYVGENVTIFTASGGVSGQGFTGVILSVNHCFVRLITRIGAAPELPFGYGVSGRYTAGNRMYGGNDWRSTAPYTIGSVADIPLVHIVSFVHTAD